MQNRQRAERPSRAWASLLLVIPFIAMLWVPSYNFVSPGFAGIPFFYWYQFLWIVVSAVITAIVYFATTNRSSESGAGSVDITGRVTHD